MKVATKKIRPPGKRHGGKAYLARRIVALMPEHRIYVEPFAGMLSVLLNKPKSALEVVGDLDANLIRFWHILARRTNEFCGFLKAIPYTEYTFDCAEADLHSRHADDFRKAAAFLIRNRFSRGGLGKTYAWSDRLRGGQPEQLNSWDTIREELPAIAERVRDVQFNQATAFSLISIYDSLDTVHYCDPPYLHETRTATKAYDHEMSRDQHEMLLDALKECQGTVLLSGYRSALYDEALVGWDRREFSMPNHSGQGSTKQRRTECLWSNRPFKQEA